jgi:hypothetical protein
MKDKIIIYQDMALYTFGLAKSLQEAHECELYSIFDFTDNMKNFFQKQQIVKYSKTWFLYDHISKNIQKPDLEYLSKIEEKYGIELWKLAYNDRIFYNYNTFYQFTPNEVLSIIEQQCKLFENILDDVKPDFAIIQLTHNFKNHLFYELCKSRGVKVMMIISGRVGDKVMISQNAHSIDYLDTKYSNEKIRTIDELKLYLNNKKAPTGISTIFLKSKLDAIKAGINFFIFSKNTNLKTHYTYYGRKKYKVFFNTIYMSLKKRYRSNFINKNFIRDLGNDKFIFFPLVTDPERSLLIDAPFHTNLLELITHIVKSLPVGYKLYVKEHPGMDSRDWRSISYYKQIMSLPNVKMIHTSISSQEIIQKSSLVITVGSTAGFEAAFYGKNTILFADTIYSVLKSVLLLKDIHDLPKFIHKSLQTSVDFTDLSKFLDIINKNSFDFDYTSFDNDINKEFFYSGFLANVDINESKMKLLLDKYDPMLKMLAREHIKKIKQHREHEH